MKTLYLDCGMGAAGDMLAAALTELLPDPDGFTERLNRLSVPGVRFRRERSVKCGIVGTRLSVAVHGAEEGEPSAHAHEHEHSHGHRHSGMADIERMVGEWRLPSGVRENVLAVYGRLAAAESAVHGVPVAEIHFHEVGAMDAVADIAAVCLLMAELSPDEVVVSPVCVGSGQVKCAHGILPVPAPAAALLLKDVPIYGGGITGELCTPTGAALLTHFADRFGEMPVMRVRAIGYGMGKKDFDRANCVRAMLGETADATDAVTVLGCNVDDMTAEEIAFAAERLLEGGANDVYTVPIGMKKSRPGTLIRVICKKEDREEMIRLLFLHTSTLGIRETETRRYVLDRTTETLRTPYGEVRRKISRGYGVCRSKMEYGDLSRIAKQEGISLGEVRRRIAEGNGGDGED